MSGVLDIFKALADEGRLRILRAIDQCELSVAELVQALEMPQSTVSRHLKPMRDAGLVASRRDGTSVYYNRGSLFRDSAFAQILTERLQEIPVAHRDAAAVERVVESRRRKSREFFDGIAGCYGTLTEPGGGWQALASGLAAGFAGKVVGDLGCGEGALSLLLARFARKVVAFDQSERMLSLVAEKAREQHLSKRLELKLGNLEDLRLPSESFDALFLSQSLHHTSSPESVVRLAAAGLKVGGQIVILDLVRHEHEWVREQWADQWLGFDPLETREWLVRSGLNIIVLDSLPGATPDLSVLIVVGEKTASF
ncbi:MAG: ArsR family transcriptional regulator [Pontiellaceae bacterium]|nr:ArsR family transcriptional regulator [Pontiellaceae bacterium]MBN2784523.1 ArsR family transcriptional regulator [Pontiellaceae bacterium]